MTSVIFSHRLGSVAFCAVAATALIAIPIGLLGIAGLAKAWDLDQFRASLASWTLLPA